MKVEIWSDVICPFCYAGKRKFEAALEQFAHKDALQIEWKSFEIDSAIANRIEPGMTIYDYLAKKRNVSYEESVAMHQTAVNMAKSVGLDYNFDKVVLSSSFNAHRIIQLAKEKGLAEAAEERLFHAYFTEGKDIGNPAELTELGKSIGLSADEVAEALTNEYYTERVKQDITDAQTAGVRRVPSYVIEGNYEAFGIQEPHAMLAFLQNAFSEWSQQKNNSLVTALEGDACTIDGDCT